MRLGCTLLLLGVVGIARADEDVKVYYDRAAAQFALGKFAEAALNFEKVFELRPDPAILYNAAQAHRLGNNKQRALDLYTSYLRIYGAHIDNKSEVQKHIENLRSAIEKDRQVVNQPPVTTKLAPVTPPPPVAKTPPPVAAPPPPVATRPVAVEEPHATALVAPAPPSEKKRVKPWVWGVVGGVAAVVVAGVVVGVVLGTASETNPKPSLGSIPGN